MCARRSVNHFHQCQAPGGGGARRLAAVARLEDLAHPLRRPLAATHLGQRARDAARQASQEALRDQLQLDEPPPPPTPSGRIPATPPAGRSEAEQEPVPACLPIQAPAAPGNAATSEFSPT